MMIRAIASLSLVLLLCCTESSNYQEKDLLQYGIPIVLMAPDSVAVETMDWGLQKDVTLAGLDGYNLQIFSSMATTSNMRVALSDYKEIARSNPYFSKFIQEDTDGFVFEVQPDSLTSYDFRHIKIQGDREYIFQMGLYGTFSLEQAQAMYKIAQEAR